MPLPETFTPGDVAAAKCRTPGPSVVVLQALPVITTPSIHSSRIVDPDPRIEPARSAPVAAIRDLSAMIEMSNPLIIPDPLITTPTLTVEPTAPVNSWGDAGQVVCVFGARQTTPAAEARGTSGTMKSVLNSIVDISSSMLIFFNYF